MTHRPDSPFGCATTWGESLPAHPDGRIHVCNRPDGHNGRHKCKCGTTHGTGGPANDWLRWTP